MRFTDMVAYYNEIDNFACDWLSNLMDGGHITPGKIDDRSICEINRSDLAGYERVHLFAGIGGWDYALSLANWSGPVWTGSCPCQPFSVAGKQLGTDDERHLWPEMFRLINECRPATIFGEQVASAAGRVWFSGVRADLETLVYAVGAADLCAAGVGAPHIRQRIFWLAHMHGKGDLRANRSSQSNTMHIKGQVAEAFKIRDRRFAELVAMDVACWGYPYAEAMRLVDGLPGYLGQLSGFGNAIVPQIAAEFIGAYQDALGDM